MLASIVPAAVGHTGKQTALRGSIYILRDDKDADTASLCDTQMDTRIHKSAREELVDFSEEVMET